MKNLVLGFLVLVVGCFLVPSITAQSTNSSLRFDGVRRTTAVRTGLSNAVVGDFTIEAWVFQEVGDTGGPILTKYNESIGKASLELRILPSKQVRFTVTQRSGPLVQFGVTTINDVIPDNNWTHISATFEMQSNTAQIYIDGNLVQIAENSDSQAITSIHVSNQAITLGWMALRNRSSVNYDGLMDEVKVWDDIRTPAEISQSLLTEFAGTEEGLILYYKFDNLLTVSECDQYGDVEDCSGNGLNALRGESGGKPFYDTRVPDILDVSCGGSNNCVPTGLSGTNPCGPLGGLGNSLAFDGIDDYVNIDVVNDTLIGEDEISIEFWMKADITNQLDANGNNRDRTMLFGHNEPTGGSNKFLLILDGLGQPNAGKIIIYDQSIPSSASFEHVSNGANAFVGDDEWHHILYSREKNANGDFVGTLYIDSVYNGSHIADNLFASNDRLSLGHEWDGNTPSDFFHGNIAEFRIWNKRFDPSEVTASMNDGELTGINPGLLAYYKFDSTGVSPTIVDFSDNGFDGIRIGANGVNNLPRFDLEMPCIQDYPAATLQFPEVSLSKVVTGYSPLTNGNVIITFDLTIENTGTADLADLEVYDDFLTQFPNAFVAISASVTTTSISGISINNSYTGGAENILASGSTLAENGQVSLSVTAEFDPSNLSATSINSATVLAEAGGGTYTSDAQVGLGDCFALATNQICPQSVLQIRPTIADCEGIVEFEDFFEGDPNQACLVAGGPLAGLLQLQVTPSDPSASNYVLASGGTIDLSTEIGETLNVQLVFIADPSVVLCNSSIQIIDPSTPYFTSNRMVMVFCDDANPLPTAEDNNCGVIVPIQVTLANITFQDSIQLDPCANGGVFREIIRDFEITDGTNTLSSHRQTILRKQVELNSTLFPQDVSVNCADFDGDLTQFEATSAGAGVPDASIYDEANPGDEVCGYFISYNDIVSSCSIANEAVRIERTWTALTGCTNVVPFEYLQIIEVVDIEEPVITFGADVTALPHELYANMLGAGSQSSCIYIGALPIPLFTDACSGIDLMSFEVFIENNPMAVITYNPAGDAIASIQVPSTAIMPLGETFEITYRVSDNCGVTTDQLLEVIVVDNTAPTPTCSGGSVVSITTTPNTAVPAVSFDAGSDDLCNPVYFKVIRMDELSGTPAACGGASVNSPLEVAANNTVFFDDEVFFCCEDLTNNPVMVILRVFDVDPGEGPVDPARMQLGGDLYLRHNECMVPVTIQDKTAPQVTCPAPQILVCTDLATIQQYTDENNTTFDGPIVNSDCIVDTTLSITDATTSCGDGTITRTFRITDSGGNTSTCTQTITVLLEHDYTIQFPTDVELDICAAMVPGTGITRPNDLIEDGCDLLAVSHVDQRFNTGSSGCYKILRTYDIINWCEWDGVSTATMIPNSTMTASGPKLDVNVSSAGVQANTITLDGQTSPAATSNGRWGYIQIIKVYDNEDPILNNIVETPCNAAMPTPGLTCGQAVSVNFDITDNCGNLSPVTYQLVEGASDTNGDGQISASELAQGTLLPSDPYGAIFAPAGSTSSTALAGTFTINGSYPIGTYVAVLDVRDLCGNVTELYVPFTSVDCNPPTLKAISFLTTSLMATGMVSCVAAHFDNGAFDACGPVFISFSADVLDTIRNFTCADIGANPLEFWVTDNSGNQAHTTVDIIIQDNLGVCNPSGTRSIAGNLSTTSGLPIENVLVEADAGTMSRYLTDASGFYEFPNVPLGADVTLEPTRNDIAGNGITTYDLYLIGQHILGMTPLSTPEQLIAADGSGSGTVSAFDITVNRRVLLGLDTEFPNNTSWRFIDANYVFPNPSNPWQEAFPETINYANLDQDMMNSNFIAIKVGDVNNSVQANSRQALAPRTLTGEFALEATNAVLPKGESHMVTFTASDLNALGYQLTLEWNPTDIEIVNIIGGAHPTSGFGKHLLEDGKLTMSHDGDMAGELFSLEVRALRDDIVLSEAFTVGSSVTVAEAFAKTGAQSVALRFSGESARALNSLEQNRPNPFSGTTQIGFTLAQASEASLIVTDATGRVIWRTEGYFEAGFEQIEIAANELPVAGLLNYTLIAGDFTATRKMLVVK